MAKMRITQRNSEMRYNPLDEAVGSVQRRSPTLETLLLSSRAHRIARTAESPKFHYNIINRLILAGGSGSILDRVHYPDPLRLIGHSSEKNVHCILHGKLRRSRRRNRVRELYLLREPRSNSSMVKAPTAERTSATVADFPSL